MRLTHALQPQFFRQPALVLVAAKQRFADELMEPADLAIHVRVVRPIDLEAGSDRGDGAWAQGLPHGLSQQLRPVAVLLPRALSRDRPP